MILNIDGNIVGTEEQLLKKKVELYNLIEAQFRFHWYSAVATLLLFSFSTVIVWLRFKEVDQGGRLYAS